MPHPVDLRWSSLFTVSQRRRGLVEDEDSVALSRACYKIRHSQSEAIGTYDKATI